MFPDGLVEDNVPEDTSLVPSTWDTPSRQTNRDSSAAWGAVVVNAFALHRPLG